MADTKISALTASTTPLAGTEVLPIVQSGVTKQVSVANLTAGRSITATNITASGEITATTNDARLSLYRATGINYFDWASGQTLAFGTQTSQGGAGRTNKVNFTDAGNIEVVTGNLVIGTSGKGIDFSATPGTGTSELLADYEEGTWTPSTAFASFVGAASSEGTYTKIGRVVVVRGSLTGGTSVTVGATGILTSDLPFSVASNAIGTMAASTNTASGNIRATGSFLVATTTIAPVTSITFTATYFV